MFRLVVLLYLFMFDVDLANHIWSNSYFYNSAIARWHLPVVAFALLPFRFFFLLCSFVHSTTQMNSLNLSNWDMLGFFGVRSPFQTHIHSFQKPLVWSFFAAAVVVVTVADIIISIIVYSNKTRKSVHRTPLEFKQSKLKSIARVQTHLQFSSIPN